jgi:amino-acid N-acetyltransferase
MEQSKIHFGFCEQNDLNKVLLLLKASNLPVEDISLDKVSLLLACSNGRIIGCIGLEQYNSNGLLRSFAVQKEFRNSGIGTSLFSHFLPCCMESGISTLYLLTETAEKYFISKGFEITDRNKAPHTIKATTEFSELCPSISSYMVLDLRLKV